MGGDESDADAPSLDEVRSRYDFESFGPRELAEMSSTEWEVAFDSASWVTGEPLLERVERELRHRVHRREVFALVERIVSEGEDCVLAYSDEGYALVRPDGSVEGFGTVLRDVKPTVALCSIPDYEPESAPADPVPLPDPAAVDAARGGLGNVVMEVLALAFLVGGLVLIGAWIFVETPLVAAIVGAGFLVGALVLGVLVANARLSARYRAEEYRDRLRSVGVDSDERPAFVPEDEAAREGRTGGSQPD